MVTRVPSCFSIHAFMLIARELGCWSGVEGRNGKDAGPAGKVGACAAPFLGTHNAVRVCPQRPPAKHGRPETSLRGIPGPRCDGPCPGPGGRLQPLRTRRGT